MFLIWRCILFSPNEIYLCLNCLKEICWLVQRYVHHTLHNFRPMYKPHRRLPFALNFRNLYLLQFDHLAIFATWSWEEQRFRLFLSFFCITFIGTFCLSCFIILCGFWQGGSWFLTKFSLNCKKFWSIKSWYGLYSIMFMFTTF